MNTFRTSPFLGIPLANPTKAEVLEYMEKRQMSAAPFFHIVSINPETVVTAHQNPALRSIYQHADLALTDGIGVLLAARILGIRVPERVSGSALLPQLLDLAGRMRSRVVLIGSQANLAESIAKCYSASYPEATFVGSFGYQNVAHPTADEEKHINAIVSATRPHFVFVAFGTPAQELWIETHKDLLSGAVCMGVGGSFDYLSGAKQRPPSIVHRLGLEWLYRLIREPWRLGRQITRLPLFIGMVIAEKMRCIIRPQNGRIS
jgi:N-acetylglucosaminyldiphosphoundecaprenol N-acetyl-beta-D-mannosaminyltransferase